jgi:hypothetical protein
MGELSLFLLVPVIVWSILVAFGFTGCSFSVTVGPQAPANLTVVTVSRTTVTLSWLNPNGTSATFEMERTREGDTAPQYIPVSSFPTDTVEIVDTNLEPDTNYLYQVRAMLAEDDTPSNPSNSVFAKTLP